MNTKQFLYVAILLGIFCLPACRKTCQFDTTYRLPGEWEEQTSVWMGWAVYENQAGMPTQSVHAEMIKALTPHVIVDLAVQDSAEIATATAELLGYGLTQDVINTKIRFHKIRHNDIWWRDMGGVFLKSEVDKQRIVDFNFNGWGYAPYTDAVGQMGFALDETVDRQIAAELNLSTVASSMILEGGAIEANGKGTILVAESVVFQRNPNLSKAAAEAELMRVLQAKKVIWLPRGVGNDVHSVEGSPFLIDGEKVYTAITTSGHTDEFVRFIDEHTILLAEVPLSEATDTIARFSRQALLAAEAVLKNATDQDGKPFNIVRMPETGTILKEVTAGDGTFDFLSTISALQIDPNAPIKVVLASSYLNYVLSNGVILMPKYAGNQSTTDLQAKDAQALQIMQGLFPQHQIVQISVNNINIGGGGMHCITQQVPK